MDVVPGDTVELEIAAKGGGSENKSKLAMLNPSDSIVDWVVKTVPTMGAGWCPPGMLGIGIGGTSEKAAVLAKRSLMDPVDIQALHERGPSNRIEELRLEIFDKVNALGIGAQGLGGLTTVVDVKILDYPTHAASMPVAMIPNCAATRHAHVVLDGSGPHYQTPPALEDWPDVTWEAGASSTRVNLDTVTREEVASWKPGDTLLLSGKMLTGRDAAHKRIQTMLANGESLPGGVEFADRFIYYVGPVDPIVGEIVGPAGPTTSTRMDKFTEMMTGELGLLGMIGKAERGPDGIAPIKKHKAVYLMAVGGAAYLVSKAIRESRIVAFEDLGMEAIREFTVEDMPVTVAVDSDGESVHATGPAIWKGRIERGEATPRLLPRAGAGMTARRASGGTGPSDGARAGALALTLLLGACAGGGDARPERGARVQQCKAGDERVASESSCLQDDAACYELASGDWCTGERGNSCPAGSDALPAGAACPPGARCFRIGESLECAIPLL